MTNEEVREVLQEQIDRYGQEYDEKGIDALNTAIKLLEQTRWIPVSERLPKESGAYLVWMIWGDEEPTYSIINFDADYNEFGEWIEHYDINTLGVLDREFRTYIDVFAWCPLPKPQKAESEDKG